MVRILPETGRFSNTDVRKRKKFFDQGVSAADEYGFPCRYRKGKGKNQEVMILAYEAMWFNESLGSRVLEILMAGVSTRKYKKVLPQIADTVGISKSSVSREFVETSAEELKQLCEKPLGSLDLLALYLDGMVFAGHHVMAALGVDRGGYKHVLGLMQGSSEYAAVCIDLLHDLVKHGMDP